MKLLFEILHCQRIYIFFFCLEFIWWFWSPPRIKNLKTFKCRFIIPQMLIFFNEENEKDADSKGNWEDKTMWWLWQHHNTTQQQHTKSPHKRCSTMNTRECPNSIVIVVVTNAKSDKNEKEFGNHENDKRKWGKTRTQTY